MSGPGGGAAAAGPGDGAAPPRTTVIEAVDAAEFRDAMSAWASGVAIVTTRGADGRQFGFTATSFTAVSMRPPMVLVCLDRDASCSAAFARANAYAVHILHSGQEQIARRFARHGEDKFADLDVRADGLPVFGDALALLECRITERLVAGDHAVLIGTVHRADRFDGSALLYQGRRFQALSKV